jgi:hypothetical protein
VQRPRRTGVGQFTWNHACFRGQTMASTPARL